MAWGGVILARDKQDLQQSFQAAKDFFEHTKPGVIKFVLIGLSPTQAVDENVLEDYFKLCLDKGATPAVVVLPVHPNVKKTYNADVVKSFRDTINRVRKKTNWRAKFIDLLDIGLATKLFKDKDHLTPEGAAAVTALLSERLYFKDVISPMEICDAGKNFFDVLSRYFSNERYFWSDDRPLIQHIFCKLACEDFNRLSKLLPRKICMNLMVSVFSELTYGHLASLTEMLPKDDYNELTTRLFNMTVKNIQRKDKIKVGFYFDYFAHWPGDDLYNVFAQDEHFETTLFVRTDKPNEFHRNEALMGLKKFKARGLNVFGMTYESIIPTQDILIRTRPYQEWICPQFRLANLKVKETLLVHVPYSFTLGVGLANLLFLYNVSWKVFFPSTIELKEFRKVNKFGMPRGIFSGYPKLDVFFKPESKFHFDWKMARPGAKKIIWAPHWSIDNSGGQRSNFRWNYQFMYEFAKAHPEISWVVKPHPSLFHQAIFSGIFPSNEALKEYFQKWDDLPNAQVYTGAYYQDIFSTSDGMIHDCDSFTAEYQYVNKPMIFLTRKEEKYYECNSIEMFKCSYLVDGKDFDGIAEMIQRVIIDGDDYKAVERKAVFDKYLNYPKLNGMLASEFIYKNISDELELNA